MNASAISASQNPSGIAAIVRAYAGSGACTEAFAAIDAYAKPVLAQALCTVNRFDAATMEVVRLYSSDPLSYPPGGRKAKRGTAWGQQVLIEKRIYVGEGEDAIRAAFDDHATILKLGLKSVINVPVVYREECLGTLNLLMTTASITPGQVDFASLLGLLALPALREL
jgi:GAF domain-containing protein